VEFSELTTQEEVRDLIQHYNKGLYDYIVLDTETRGLDRHDNELLAITVTGSQSGKAYFIDGRYAKAFDSLKVPLTLHNFKFDFHMFNLAGVDLRNCGLRYDTLILDHLLDENNTHALDDIIQRRYKDNYKEEFWSKYDNYGDAPHEEQVAYACKDVLYTDRVAIDTLSDLDREGVPRTLIEHVNKLALVLYNTEKEGLIVDLPYVSTRGEYLNEKIRTLKSQIRNLVDLECQMVENELYEKELDKRKTPKGKRNVSRPQFSFDSPLQLGSLIYDHLGLPVQLNKQRNRTVDDTALSELEDKHPFIPLLREYRGHQKVFTSFIEGTLEKLHNGKIYPTFNPCGTVTSRISSSGPNLQQLPSQGGIRGIYIPRPGYKFISRDYSQLEIVIAAHFSQDSNMLKIVLEGASQHDITAAGLGIERSKAKMINFAMIYGAGVNKIKSILECSDKEAEIALEKYWNTYPGLKKFMKVCHDKVERGIPLETPFGRRRHFPKKFDTKWDLERAKRQAANSIIQSTGGDCTNRSFYLVDAWLRDREAGKALIAVHDEIIIEVKDNYTTEADEALGKIMSSVGEEIKLTLTLTTSSSGPMSRWED
jgi:DNA polymerase-1